MEANEEQQPSDEQLAGKVQNGDVGAFDMLLQRYQAKILRYGNKFLLAPQDIEDVTQEIFLKVYRFIKSFDASRKFSPWIYGIAHNEFINLGKKRKGEPVHFFDFDTFFPHPSSKESPEKDLDKKHMAELLESYLNKIPAKYREPLVLYYLEDLSYSDIADVLRIPVTTVGVRLNRAKARLKAEAANFKHNPL